MFETKLKIIYHVLTILYIEKKGHQILLYQGIDYVIKIILTNHETYQ